MVELKKFLIPRSNHMYQYSTESWRPKRYPMNQNFYYIIIFEAAAA